MTCAHCGRTNEDGAAACEDCGQPLTPAAPAAGVDSGSPGVAAAPADPHEEAAAAFERAFDTVTPHVVVTYVLMALNVAVFIAMAVAGMPLLKPPADFLVRAGATYGPLVTHGQWWRLLTGMFMHAGILHLLFNMWALFSIGVLTERIFGNTAFFILYMIAGLGGGLAGLYWHPMTAAVGASGAIFGLYGALFAFLLRQHATIPRHFVTSVGFGAAFFLVYNVVYGLGNTGIDMAAHLGGLAAGGAVGLALARPLVPSPTSVSVRRNTLVAAVALAIVVALAIRVPAVDDYRVGLEALTVLEQQSQKTVNTSLAQLRDGHISEDQFANTVEQKVLPAWRAHRQALTKMQLPRRERDVVAKAVSYMDLRGDAWALAARGIRTHDSALIQQSNSVQVAAARVAAELMNAINPGTQPGTPAVEVSPNAENFALQQEFQRFQALEPRLIGEYNTAVAQLRTKKLSGPAFADRLESVLLPQWNEEYQRLVKVKASGAGETRRQQLAEYMRLRGESWRLTAQGVRKQSPTLLKEAAATESKAVALLQPLTGRPEGAGPARH